MSCSRPPSALCAHELEQGPAVTIASEAPPPGAALDGDLHQCSGSGYRAAHLVPRRLRAGSGSVGHHLDAAGGAPSELSGGSSDAPGGCRYAARVRQHESLEESLPTGSRSCASSRWEEHRAEFEEVLRAEQSVPCAATTVAVSLDGVMAPMKRGAAGEACRNAG